jgi:hypothetical protein
MFVQTLSYFASWGTFYGMLLGACVGTAFMPMIGTVLGGIFGLVMGLGASLPCAIVTHLIHQRSFHEDIDLDAYSRRLTRLIGVLGGVSAVVMLWLSTGLFLGVVGNLPGETDAPLVWMGTLMVSFPALFIADFAAAYIASHYPAWIVPRFRLSSPLDAPPEAAPGDVESAFKRLIDHTSTNAVTIASGAISFILYMALFIGALIQQRYIKWDEIAAIFLVAPVGALVGALGWRYLAFGNAMILSFLKRVIYREHLPHLSAHWYRISLTLISFALTWAMIWWTTIPGPIIAFIMAFVVSRTLALPDEPFDKAKRKEKNALALQDESDEEDDLLMDEDPIIEASRGQ